MAFCQNTKISRHTSIPFTAHSLGNPVLVGHALALGIGKKFYFAENNATKKKITKYEILRKRSHITEEIFSPFSPLLPINNRELKPSPLTLNYKKFVDPLQNKNSTNDFTTVLIA